MDGRSPSSTSTGCSRCARTRCASCGSCASSGCCATPTCAPAPPCHSLPGRQRDETGVGGAAGCGGGGCAAAPQPALLQRHVRPLAAARPPRRPKTKNNAPGLHSRLHALCQTHRLRAVRHGPQPHDPIRDMLRHDTPALGDVPGAPPPPPPPPPPPVQLSSRWTHAVNACRSCKGWRTCTPRMSSTATWCDPLPAAPRRPACRWG